MIKKLSKILIIIFFIPTIALAQDSLPQDQIFKAEVIRIIEENTVYLPDGSESIQQYLELRALEGDFRGESFEFNGIGEIDVINKLTLKPGDKVLAAASYGLSEEPIFYVVDYVRNSRLWLLFALFLAVLVLVGRLKGIRSLIALALSFLIITKYIIPQILSGASPLLVTLMGSFLILLIIIYITEGFKARAHLSVISISLSLVITVALSYFFVSLTRLSGAASEEVLFLFNIGGAQINLAGLLLAGIIIGALGVLDDVIISQVATTEEISQAGQNLSLRQVYKKSYSVGVSHIASMTNTLFLAYAGASLPLLILFTSGESAFSSLAQALNTELIATEIVRTLTGSIGLILSVPIATLVSSWWYTRK